MGEERERRGGKQGGKQTISSAAAASADGVIERSKTASQAIADGVMREGGASAEQCSASPPVKPLEEGGRIVLESQEGFEFEYGRGAMCEQAEAVIGQMIIGQTATFVMMLPLPLPPLPGVPQPIMLPSGKC